MDDKVESMPGQSPVEVDNSVIVEKNGTYRDVEDMRRMGKQQLFKVSHKSL